MARKPIIRDAQNQVTRYSQPDPNDAMPTFDRNDQGPSAYAPGNAANMQKNPISLAMLRQAADQTDQGMADQYADSNQRLVNEGRISSGDAIQNQRNNAMNQTAVKIMNPDMRLYMQTLKNAGVNKLRTGAKAFGDAPGFFDVQDNRNLEKQSLANLLKASDLNTYGKVY